jgi:hypothetical protein
MYKPVTSMQFFSSHKPYKVDTIGQLIKIKYAVPLPRFYNLFSDYPSSGIK